MNMENSGNSRSNSVNSVQLQGKIVTNKVFLVQDHDKLIPLK